MVVTVGRQAIRNLIQDIRHTWEFWKARHMRRELLEFPDEPGDDIVDALPPFLPRRLPGRPYPFNEDHIERPHAHLPPQADDRRR